MPSANISSRLSPVNAQVDVYEEFKNISLDNRDGGKSKIRIESTVVDLTRKTKDIKTGNHWF